MEYIGKMKKFFLLFFFLIYINTTLFSENLLFNPLNAYVFEPRIGSIINLNNDNLRLDIGASFDLIRFENNQENLYNAIGADFFTYTRLRSEPNFKFPVETSDYFFGINYSNKIIINNLEYALRLRISHISSHLVDGFSNDGIFRQKPFIYSRELIELISILKININENFDLKPILGGKYIFSTTPDSLTKLNYIIGLDYSYKFNNYIEFIGGIIIQNGENTTNFSLQNGMKIKFIKNIGLFIGQYYYSGNSIHGMFYNNFDELNSIGFQIIYN